MPNNKPSTSVAFSEREYRFDKVLATIVYLASQPDKVTHLDKKKAISLLFLADKLHLLRYGRPIFGEEYKALPWGAVPQRTLDRLDEFETTKHPGRDIKLLDESLNTKRVARHEFAVYVAKVKPNLRALSELELEVINEVIEQHGRKTFRELDPLIHTKAWKKAFDSKPAEKNAWPMRYEDFFEGDPDATRGAFEEMIENSRTKQALSGLR